MSSRKSFDQLSPAYRHRLEAAAAKRGIPVSELRANPKYAKAARGHARSEGHIEAPHYVGETKHTPEQWRVGGAYVSGPLESSGYRNAKTPSREAILAALKHVSTRFVRVAVQVIMEGYFPNSPSGLIVGWITAVVPTRLMRTIPDLPTHEAAAALVNEIIPTPNPAVAVLAWSFANVPEDTNK